MMERLRAFPWPRFSPRPRAVQEGVEPEDGPRKGGRETAVKREGGLYALWRLALPILLGLTLGWFASVCLGIFLARFENPALLRHQALGVASNQEETERVGLEEFLAANPFRISPMKPLVVEEKPSEVPVVVKTPLADDVLRGTLPGVGAWLEEKGQVRLVLVGMSFDVYTLEEVSYREAVFVDEDDVVVRELLYGPVVKREPAPAAPVSAPAPAPAANVPAGEIVAAKPGEQDGQVPSELVNQLVQNPFDELKKVRLRPKGDDGLQIQWIQNESILKKLGVQKGDVIKSINGIAFNNMADIANSINSLMNSERFDVEVERKGKPTELRYVVR